MRKHRPYHKTTKNSSAQITQPLPPEQNTFYFSRFFSTAKTLTCNAMAYVTGKKLDTGFSKIVGTFLTFIPVFAAAESRQLNATHTGQLFNVMYDDGIYDSRYPSIETFFNQLPSCNVTLVDSVNKVQEGLESVQRAFTEFAKYECSFRGIAPSLQNINTISLREDQPFNDISQCLKNILDGFNDICESLHEKQENEQRKILGIIGLVLGGIALLAAAKACRDILSSRLKKTSEVISDRHSSTSSDSERTTPLLPTTREEDDLEEGIALQKMNANRVG